MKKHCQVMGILNVSGDSFFDGGRYATVESAVQRAAEMLEQGADIIDVGAVSTRPGAADILESIEIQCVATVITALRNQFPTAVLSVDTWRSSVAEQAVAAGANWVNDISGGTFDARMPATIARLRVPYILMHTTAKPDRMQQCLLGENPIAEIMRFFGRQIDIFKSAGCKDLILDPGFGFGKTLEQNYLILNNLPAFQLLEFPVLVGVSRKSMIGKPLGVEPCDALNGTTALHAWALQGGADFLRVHDVREAVQTVKLWEMLNGNR